MLTVQPEKPRLVVFTLRSYAGSRSALLLSGEALLMASPRMKVLNGSMLDIFAPDGPNPGYMVLTDSFESSLPIANLLGIARSVEERLNDPQKPGDRTNLRVDLVFVHGVELKTPEVELPHPALFDRKESWAISTFVRATEEYFTNPIEAMKVQYAWKHAAPPRAKSGRSPSFRTPQLKRSPQRDEWKVTGLDWPDALVEAARAVAMAHAYRERTSDNKTSPTGNLVNDEESGGADLVAADSWVYIEEAMAELVEYVTSDTTPGATDSEVAEAWLTAVRESMRLHSMRVASAVVYEATAKGVRGAILGTKARGNQGHLDFLEVRADRDPADLRRWNTYHDEPNETRIEFTVPTSFSKTRSPD